MAMLNNQRVTYITMRKYEFPPTTGKPELFGLRLHMCMGMGEK